MKKYIYLVFISILLFTAGFIFYNGIESFLLESFKKYNMAYSQINSQFLNCLKFGLICGIVPTVINFVWRKTNAKKYNLKTISVLLFLTTTIMFVIVRNSLLKSELESQKMLSVNGEYVSGITTVESLNLPLYIFIGEILGFILMYAFLQKVKSKD